MPTWVIFDPTYATSTAMFVRQLALNRQVPLLDVARPERAIDREHALAQTGVGVGAIGATLGPFASANAGVMLSSVRCETVWRNGNTGVVNGVVMPAISIQTRP